MRALGDDAAAVHDHDAVGLQYRRQPVGDDQRGAALHQSFQCVLHRAFALRIEGTGRFVQQQDRRVLQQRAGDDDALLLAAGQARAALAQFAGETFGKFADEVIGFG